MTYYLLQNRELRLKNGLQPAFPSMVRAKIRFGPEDAFGVAIDPPHLRTTAMQSKPANLLWNANEGTSQWEGELIDALGAEITQGDLSASWTGNELIATFTVRSQDEANRIVSSINHLLPAFLSLRLRVFVWIKEFVVEIGDAYFRFETLGHRYEIAIATTERNNDAVSRSLRDWTLTRHEHLRVIMGIYYYRHAQRLAVQEPDRQSMSAEVILNLAKAIEIVFSSNRDQLRSMAREWGFESEFIERWIIPILLIRNELNVGHATSAPLTGAQHQTVLDFLNRAFWHVHELLETLIDKTLSGELDLEPPSESLDEDKERLLRRIEEYAASC